MKCAECGREISNPHYINGTAYGYNCYKLKLAIIYKQWEDERNHEYSVKCFSAMQVFTEKKSNSFHDSIVKQWNDCKKLTAKQLECIIKGFTFSETISFYKVWFALADEENRRSISNWTIHKISCEHTFQFLEDELVHKIIKNDREYSCGFHFLRDIEDEPEIIFIYKNGKYLGRNKAKERQYDNSFLKANQQDEYIEVLKIIT